MLMYGLVVGIGWQFVVVSLLISRLKLQHLENNIYRVLHMLSKIRCIEKHLFVRPFQTSET